jgi:hypothetical protein
LLQLRWYFRNPSVTAGAACALTLASPAYAARPLITDDARIVDAKACQLETWVRRNENSTEYWALPACNPTGNLELTVGGAKTNEFAETHTSDVQVQGKTLFKALEKNSWGTGLAFGWLRHPQTEPDRGFGANLYAYVPTSFSFADDRFVVHTNFGTLRAEEETHHRFIWGLGAELRVNSRLFFIPEVFSQRAGRPHFQVGARYWVVPGRMQIDATIGDRIGGSDGERWFSIGFRLLSPAFLP